MDRMITNINDAFPKRLLPLCFLIITANAISQEPMTVPRLTEKIIFDGVPDESTWLSIPSLNLVMHAPIFGAKPTETTLLKVAYDNDYFYVSAIMYFEDPANLRAFSKKRDYSNATSDWFGIFLDTFNDRENTLMFWTNPNGVRTDGTTKNDVAVPETDFNFNWNTFWDTKTRINDQGWSAEVRIPFSSLRFQTTDENITRMGLTLVRFDAAYPETSSFPPIPADYAYAFLKASQTKPVEFEGIRPESPLYFTPYLSAGIGQTNELNDEETDYEMSTKPKFDIGFDAKYSIANKLTLDVTVNTDFAQVEADDQKINLTRYSLYFPEKRVFFLEKNDVFDFSFLGGNNLFYSRRIGLYDGNPVRIYGGVRMTGRVNKWDVGFLDMHTAAIEDNPSENFGVLRAKRSVFNQYSYLGAIMTSRLGMDGSYNLAYGLDGQFRITGDEYLTVRWAQTFEEDSVNRILDWAPSRFLLNWVRRKNTGFGYDLAYTWSGDQYNPGIGFEIKDNYQGFRIITQYGRLPADNALLRYHKISLTAYTFWNTATRLRETVSSMLTWQFEAKKGHSGNIAANWFLEDVYDSLSLGNDQAYVPPGSYSFAYLSSMISTSRSKSLYADFTADGGGFYDGLKLSLFANPMMTVGPDFDMGVTYYLDYVNFPDRETSFINHIVGVKGLLTLTTKTSFSAFVQYNTSVDKFIGNFRFRYNPREGNDLYIVYDEGLNTDLSRETPRMPMSSGRTLLLKYTYTFILRPKTNRL